MAISLLLIAFLFHWNKRKLLSYIFCALAVLIHTSSIFGIIVFAFLSLFKNLRLKMKFLYPIFIIASIFYNFLFGKIIMQISGYENYLNYNSTAGIGTYVMILFYFILTVFIILPHRKKLENANQVNKYAVNMLVIANCLMLLQMHNWLFSRLVIYMTIFMPIVISDYYEIVEFNKKKFFSLIFYIAIFIYYIVYVNSFGGVVPYRMILFIN